MTKLVTEPLPSEQYARTAPDNDEDRGHCQIRRRAGKLLIAFALGMARRQAPASRPRTLGATSRPGNRQVRADALKCAQSAERLRFSLLGPRPALEFAVPIHKG